MAAAYTLQQTARNPEKFRLRQVIVMESGAACIDYRAQNGFGGMGFGSAVYTARGELLNDSEGGFTHAWDRECAHKLGENLTNYVAAELRAYNFVQGN